MPSFESAYAWYLPIYTWSKDWQYVLAGLLAVLAACIFAIGNIKAARIRAGTPRSSIRRADLRSMGGPTHDEPKPAAPLALAPVSLTSESPAPLFSPQDLSPNLDHLRWLIRTGLSPQLSSDVSQTSLIGCCERIGKLKLESAALPDRASETAQTQRKALLQDANALRQLADTQASSSEIISALIKLNASARELAASLSNETTGKTGAANLSG
jgi:hypothetical protein